MRSRSQPSRRRRPAGAPLPERLVAVVDELLEQDGVAALTLREVARRAGVTHSAPLRHYRSFSRLLAEAAAAGFRELEAAVDAAAAAVPARSGATARIAAAARAYVGCAVKRPGRFALMFRPDLLDASHPGFARDASGAFEQLVRLVRGAQDAGWRSDAETRRLAGSLWAGVHGLATLWLQQSYAYAVRVPSLDDAVSDLIELFTGAAAAAPPIQTKEE
jgi:AcrR family transcriptional regulator